MDKKVYFSGSVRGGRQDAALYRDMISHIQQTDTVLTPHVGGHNFIRQGRDDVKIYQNDIAWLKECDLVIAECTNASLGVGYELAYAEGLGKPVYVFYHQNRVQLSANITGNDYFRIIPYETEEQVFTALDDILGR